MDACLTFVLFSGEIHFVVTFSRNFHLRFHEILWKHSYYDTKIKIFWEGHKTSKKSSNFEVVSEYLDFIQTNVELFRENVDAYRLFIFNVMRKM